MYNFSYLQIRQLLWEEGTIIFTECKLVFLSCQGILIRYVTQNRFPKILLRSGSSWLNSSDPVPGSKYETSRFNGQY